MPPPPPPLPPPQALFCQVPTESVLTMHDVSNIWQVPILMQSQGAHQTICKQLGLQAAAAKLDLHAWKTGVADRCAARAQQQQLQLQLLPACDLYLLLPAPVGVRDLRLLISHFFVNCTTPQPLQVGLSARQGAHRAHRQVHGAV